MHSKPIAALILTSLGFAAPPVCADFHANSPRINVGQVRAGAPLVHAFDLINDETHDVEILEARGSCGCLKPQLDKKLIKPGDRAKLLMTINTLGQGSGPHSWTARVRYRSAGGEAELGVAVQADVITEVTVQPAAVTLIASGPISEVVTVSDLRQKTFTIKAVETSIAGLKARLIGQSRDAQGRWVARLQLDATEKMTPGRHAETLSIYTDDPLYQHVQVPVTVIKTPAKRVSAFPDQVRLAPASGQTSCLVRLHAPHEKPLRISGIEIGDPSVKCKWAAGPDQDITMRIQLDSTEWTGRDLDTIIHVRFENPAGELLSLPIHIHKQ